MTIRDEEGGANSAGDSRSEARRGVSQQGHEAAPALVAQSSTAGSSFARHDEPARGAPNGAAAATAPQRVFLSGRSEVVPTVVGLIARAQRTIRIADSDLSRFALEALTVSEALERFLISHRQARVRLLADSNSWQEQRGARLHHLQRNFSHALEIRIASSDDPVGEDSYLLADENDMLSLRPTALAIGEVWHNNSPHAQPWSMAFERRWHAASHSLPATPLGL